MAYLVLINDHQLRIPDDAHHALERNVLLAVAAGGDFVDIHDIDMGAVRFLITPATTIRIQHQAKADAELNLGFPDLSFLDLEEYSQTEWL